MNTLLVLILALAVASGQLIKVPVGVQGGITVLDMTISLFCFWGLLKTKFHLKKPPSQIIAALVFVAVATTSLMFTPLHLNFNEYVLSFSYTLRFFLYVLFAWLIFSNAFSDLKKDSTRIFLLSGIAFAALGLEQFIFFPNLSFLSYVGWDPHYFRTVSTFLDPNFTGAFLVLTLILLTSSYLRGGNTMTPRVFIILFTIIYLALLTTFSRSSYLMFLVSGLTFSFLKKSKIYFLSTLILFAILLLGFQIYTQLVTTPRNIDRDQSASSRFNTWQQGFALFQKSPILGIGYNAYRYGIAQYNLGDKKFLDSHGSSGNDSSLLFVASTTGIIGLLAYLYFLFSLVSCNYSQYRGIILPAVLGLLIHSFFANSLFYPPILAWILLISLTPKK